MAFPTHLLAGRGPQNADLRIEGHWPKDLHGTAYWILPDTRGPGAGAFFAPGILARVRLDGCGATVPWRSAHVETPDFRLQQRTPELFRKTWIGELSPYGMPNAANTNPLPFKGRMLLTWDGGRPVEVDAGSGQFITNVGERSRWLEGMAQPLLPMIATTAHPVYDHERDVVWGVNYKMALGSSKPAELRVVRWDTQGPPTWRRLAGSHLRQYIHEVGQTRDHLVLAQGAFRLEMSQAIDGKRSRPNRPDSPLWIVNKHDLERGDGDVGCVEVVLQRELNHVFCDYDDGDGIITLYAQHTPSFDINCWLKPGDYSELTGEPIPPELVGMYGGAMDVCPLGRYRIDARSGEVLEATLQGDPERHWMNNLYAKSYAPEDVQRHTTLFHCYTGHHPELVTEEIYKLYAQHPYRTVPARDVPVLTIAGCLDRVDLEQMKVVDGYRFQEDELHASPLWIPKVGARRQEQAWVLTLRLDGENTQLAVFDGEALGRGPVATASAEGFKLGLPLHSAWTAESPGRDSEYRVGFSCDVGPGYDELPSAAKRAAEALMRELG